MWRKSDALGALAVRRLLKEPGFHHVGGVQGLALKVRESGAASWVLRVAVSGKRSDIGLGSYPGTPLEKAREYAEAARHRVREGADPLAERRARRAADAAAKAKSITFDTLAADFIRTQSVGWRNSKHASQWTNTLKKYASPFIGHLPVGAIERVHVLQILEQKRKGDPEGPTLWVGNTVTATRVRERIECILDAAIAKGLRDEPNPAKWKAGLEALLPAPSKVSTVENLASCAVGEVGEFVAAVRQREGQAARAVEFAIMCASRSGEVRGATWGEVDLATATWTIPAGRMKGKKEHRVALNDRAVEILKAQPKGEPGDLIFPAKGGKPLSDMTLTACIKRMAADREGGPWIDPKTGGRITMHGFRTTFRAWATERTAHPTEVVERALAHAVGNDVQRAYDRTDQLDKRRALMRDWGVHCSIPETSAIANATIYFIPSKPVAA